MPNYQGQTDNPVADYTSKLGEIDSYMYSVQHAKDMHLASLPAQAEPTISLNVNEFGIPEDMSLSTPDINLEEEERPLFERLFNAAPEPVQKAITPFVLPFFNNPVVSGMTMGGADAVNGILSVGRDINNALHPDNQFTEEEWLRIPELLESNPDSTTEGVVRGLTQFMSIFTGLGGLKTATQLGGKGKQLFQQMLAGGLADASFNPDEANISTLIDQLDLVDDDSKLGALTEWLGAPVDDDAPALERLEKRVKNVFEGATIGFAVGGFIEAMKFIKKSMPAAIFVNKPEEQDTASFIKSFEGYKDIGYYATKGEASQDLVTVGYGSTGRVKKGEKITEEQAEQYLQEDIAVAEKAVDSLVTVDLTPNQKSAVVSLVFNIGQGNFKNSKALQALNKGDMDTFVKEAFDSKIGFVKANGKILKGLVKRRKAEKTLFQGGIA